MERTREAGAEMEMEEEIVRIAWLWGVVGVLRPRAGGQVDSIMIIRVEKIDS